MKGKILGLIVGFLFIGVNVFAADGDLIVNGNVGIGTTNPAAKLHINYDTTSSLGQVILKSSTRDSAASGAKLSWYNDAGSEVAAIQAVNNAGDGIITFHNFVPWTGPLTERMRIDGNGNVGIGTATPYAKHHVKQGSGDTVGIRISRAQADGNPMLQFSDDVTYNNNIQLVAGTYNLAIAPNFGDVGIGTTDPGGYRLYVAGTAYSTGGWQSSDVRFKDNIKPIESPLDKILSIEGITFDWKTDEFRDKGFPDGRHYGVVAQKVEKILPEVVKEGPGGEKSVSYTELVPVLIEAMKEQQKTIEKQQREMKELKIEINQLRSSIPKNVASLQP